MSFWKRLFCRHDGKLDFVGDIRGDNINRKACDPCDNPDCHHTYDIRHALNFERVSGSTYLWVEKETPDEQTP